MQLRTEVINKLKNLILAQSAPRSSSEICCISVKPGQFSIAYGVKTDNKVELKKCQRLDYQGQSLDKALSKFLEENNLKNVNCTWVLDHSAYQLMASDDLPLKPEEFQSAIRLKIKKLISFPVEEAIIDHFSIPVNKYNHPKKIMLVITKKSYLEPLCEQIQKSGLILSTIDIPELSFKNMIDCVSSEEDSYLFFYLEDKKYYLIITYGKKIYFTRLLDSNINNQNSGDKDINQFADQLSLEVQRSLEYFQTEWNMTVTPKLLYVEKDEQFTEIMNKLSANLNLQIKKTNISEYMKDTINLSSRDQSEFLPILSGLLR